ncbi:MFS transporter [Actinomadura nitritigenes]|uniref:MFS transporter n=1 Tax=Actinomadura nitritigenes TaxID=134602 RepID=UPI003D8D4591
MTAVEASAETAVERLPRRVRWGYGGGEWANAVMWTAFSSLFLYYITDVVHGDAALAGALMMIGSLWNTVLQPYIGLVSDRRPARLGRRRPFLAAAAAPFAVSSWLLFTDPGFTGTLRAVYYLLVVLVWFSSLTTFYVPYSTLGAELTPSTRERTALSTVRTAFSQVGALVGAISLLLLHGWLEPMLGGSKKGGWSAAAAVVGLVATAGILTTWHTSRGRERTDVQEHTLQWRDIIGLLRSRCVRLLMGLTAFGWTPLSVTAAVSVYFGVHVMGFSEDTASLVMLCWFVAGLAWLPLVSLLTRKLGKQHTYVVFTLAWLIVQCLFLLPHPYIDKAFWGLVVLSAPGSMAVAVTGWSMLADLTDAEQLRTGKRNEGAVYGLGAFAQTGMAAVAVLMVGLVLSAVGYDGDGTPDSTALLAIRLLMSVGTAIWLIPGMIFALRYPITTARHQAIRAHLESGEGDRDDLVRGL